MRVLSQAELGHFNFSSWNRAVNFFWCMYSFFSSKFFFYFYQFLNQKIIHFQEKKYYSLQRKLKMQGEKIQVEIFFQFSNFWVKNNQLKGKGHKPSRKSFSSSSGLAPTRISEGVSRANSKKCEVTAKYSPQILTVHMYTAKKLALQANIFKISNVEYIKSVRTIFSASNHFLYWFSYMYQHFLNN